MADDMGNLSEEFESLFEGEDFSETLTRSKFEKLNTDLFRETLKPVPEFLEDDDLTKKDFDEIVPVGGPIRIPTVKSHFWRFSKRKTRNEKEEWGII